MESKIVLFIVLKTANSAVSKESTLQQRPHHRNQSTLPNKIHLSACTYKIRRVAYTQPKRVISIIHARKTTPHHVKIPLRHPERDFIAGSRTARRAPPRAKRPSFIKARSRACRNAYFPGRGAANQPSSQADLSRARAKNKRKYNLMQPRRLVNHCGPRNYAFSAARARVSRTVVGRFFYARAHKGARAPSAHAAD